MADSWSSRLFDLFSNAASRVGDDAMAIGQGALEESLNPNREVEIPFPESFRDIMAPKDREDRKQYQEHRDQQSRFLMNLLEAPTRAIDRASEYYTGAPALFSRDQSLLTPVIPGVSKDEASKAATKLADAQAEVIRKEAARKEVEKSVLQARLSQLEMESSPESLVFVGDKSGVESSNKSSKKGSFSKTPTQNEESRYIAKLKKQGVPENLIDVITNLKKSKTNQELEAAKTIAGLTPNKITPEQEDLAILDRALSSKDPVGSMIFVKAMLRRKGRSEEYINQLINGTNLK